MWSVQDVTNASTNVLKGKVRIQLVMSTDACMIVCLEQAME